jgi:Helix-turn-helix domain
MNDSDDETLIAFGEFVRAQRRLAQVSQRNLARMLGVSDSYLSQIERGNYRPSPQVVNSFTGRSRRHRSGSAQGPSFPSAAGSAFFPRRIAVADTQCE